MKIGKHLKIGGTLQSGNVYYVGFTYMWLIRGVYFAIDLFVVGFYVQLTWTKRKSSHPELVK